MLIFALMNLYAKRKIAEKVAKKEEERLVEAKLIQEKST